MTQENAHQQDRAYADKIGQMLADLPEDAIFDLEKNVKLDNREKFIAVVKEFIALRFGHLQGWELSFNADYSRIRKNATAASLQAYNEQAAKERKLRISNKRQ